MLRVIASLALLLAAALRPAWGADVQTVNVSEKDGRYTMSFDAVIDVPVDEALRLMLTPGLWPQLSPIIIDAKVLAKDDSGPRKVRVTFYACVFIFCKTIHKTEDITIGTNGHIESLAVPEQSDFSYAHEDWHFLDQHGRTHIHYETEMVPSFFVPPLIGPYIIKSRMEYQLIHTADNLEKLARRPTIRTSNPSQ